MIITKKQLSRRIEKSIYIPLVLRGLVFNSIVAKKRLMWETELIKMEERCRQMDEISRHGMTFEHHDCKTHNTDHAV